VQASTPSDDPDQSIREAFIAHGAVSPGSARPLRDFPPIPPERLTELLDRGVIREGDPGAYYLHVQRSPPPSWRRFLITLLFWILVIFVVIALVRLAGR
jgi:hypothetical protein